MIIEKKISDLIKNRKLNPDEIINQLDSLKEHCREFVDEEYNDIWTDDVIALNVAINVLRILKNEVK